MDFLNTPFGLQQPFSTPTPGFDPCLPFSTSGLDFSGWPSMMPPPINNSGSYGSGGSMSLSPSSWMNENDQLANHLGSAGGMDMSTTRLDGRKSRTDLSIPMIPNSFSPPNQTFDQIASGLIAPPLLPSSSMAVPPLPPPPPPPTMAIPDLPPSLFGMEMNSAISASLQSVFSQPSGFCVSSVPVVETSIRIDDQPRRKTIDKIESKTPTTTSKKRRRTPSTDDSEDDADDDEEPPTGFEETDFFECGVRCTFLIVVSKSQKYDEDWIATALEHVFVNGFDVNTGHVQCHVTRDLETALKGDEPKVRKRGRPPKKKRRCDMGISLGIDASKIALHVTVEIAKEDGQDLEKMVSYLTRESMIVLLRHVLRDDDVDIFGSVKSVSLIGVFESKLKAWEEFEAREEIRRKRKRDRERTRRLRKKQT